MGSLSHLTFPSHATTVVAGRGHAICECRPKFRLFGDYRVVVLGVVSPLERLRIAATAELVRREKVRAALAANYEAAPGPDYCVRRLEVVEDVARTLGIRVLNNAVFVDVERRARELGWESVKNGGRSLFRRVRRRGLDEAEALAISRSNRSDPRSQPATRTGAPVGPVGGDFCTAGRGSNAE